MALLKAITRKEALGKDRLADIEPIWIVPGTKNSPVLIHCLLAAAAGVPNRLVHLLHEKAAV